MFADSTLIKHVFEGFVPVSQFVLGNCIVTLNRKIDRQREREKKNIEEEEEEDEEEKEEEEEEDGEANQVYATFSSSKERVFDANQGLELYCLDSTRDSINYCVHSRKHNSLVRLSQTLRRSPESKGFQNFQTLESDIILFSHLSILRIKRC